MIAGPQILSAVFIATSEGWRRGNLERRAVHHRPRPADRRRAPHLPDSEGAQGIRRSGWKAADSERQALVQARIALFIELTINNLIG
jgi:hypothetical protein